MNQVRIKKRPWRPKPSDAPPKPRGKIRLIRLEPDPKVQKCPQKSQTKADVSQLAGFLKKPYSSETTVATTGAKSTCNVSLAIKPESRASNVTMATNGTCDTRKPCDMVNTSPQDRKIQKCPQKSQTKADVSQLAGFLKKPYSSETTIATTGAKFTGNMSLGTKPETCASNVIMKASGTCDTRKPNDMVNTSPQEGTGVQSSIRSQHGTDLGPDTKPVCVKDDRESSPQIELDNDFDYSLDLMGNYTLTSDSSKKPTPFWFETENNVINDKLQNAPAKQSTPDNIKTGHGGPSSDNTNYKLVKQFSPETGHITNILCGGFRRRGVKRKIPFDDDDLVPVPRKRSRTC